MERVLPIREVQDNPIYGGLVETMDTAVGIVLKALKENGLDQASIEYTRGFTEDVFQISLDKELALKKTVSLYDGINRFIKEII